MINFTKIRNSVNLQKTGTRRTLTQLFCGGGMKEPILSLLQALPQEAPLPGDRTTRFQQSQQIGLLYRLTTAQLNS
jgi:hypothetical protein